MKFNGKLFFITYLTFTALYVGNVSAKPIKKSNEVENINDAYIKDSEKIKDSESITASTTYNNLPKEEVINTLFEDPLSEEFMGKSSTLLNKERNRSTSDLLSEFEGQAKVINDNTEVPDNIVDEHTLEERKKIEAKADKFLKEAAIKASNENSGNNLEEDSKEKFEKLNTKIENLDKEDEEPEPEITNEVLYKENETPIEETKESIGNAIIKEEWPNSEEDPEFVNKKPDEQPKEPDNVEIIEVQDTSEPDNIPDYAKMEGIIPVDKETKDNKIELNESTKEKEDKKKEKKSKKLKKMSEPLEPVLITDAKPKSDDDETNKVYTYTGMLIPEKQPLGRGKNMLRWVLQLEDGSRIPLKSNLKLLQEVRKESNLEDYVVVSGKMRTSSYDKELRFLIPDTVSKGSKKQTDKNLAKKAN